ncbi:MAG: cell division protein ZapA [Desulfuromonadales bacterium]|nr:cell division protein ZapA [Desulfuromonadales bacterium]
MNIKILGREYNLRSQESAEQTGRVVSFVEERLAETAAGRSVDTRDLTVLTLLNLAGQYLQLLEQQKQNGEQHGDRLQQLVEQLESELVDNSGC